MAEDEIRHPALDGAGWPVIGVRVRCEDAGPRAIGSGVDVTVLNPAMLQALHSLKHRWTVGPGAVKRMRGLERFGYARRAGGTEFLPEYEITQEGLDYLEDAGTCRPGNGRLE